MDDPVRAVSYAAPALVGVLSIPPVWRFAGFIRRGKAPKLDRNAIYEDRDGAATEESMKKYSTKKQYTAIFLGCGLGLAAALALVVVATSHRFPDITRIWLLFWSWVCSNLFLRLSIPLLTRYRFWRSFKYLILSESPGL